MNPVYTAKVREYARRLYEENGWSTHQIRKALEGRGFKPPPSHCTIRCWVDNDYREERLRRQRHFMSKGPDRRWKRGWQQRLARMEEMRAAGVTVASIARLMCLDFDLDLSENQARYILSGEASVRTIKRRLYPKAAA